MAVFTPVQTAGAVAQWNDSLIDTCTLVGFTTYMTDGGGRTRTAADGATVPCRLKRSQRLPQEAEAGGQQYSSKLYQLGLPAGTVVGAQQQARLSSGRLFRVTGGGPTSFAVPNWVDVVEVVA